MFYMGRDLYFTFFNILLPFAVIHNDDDDEISTLHKITRKS